MQANFTPRSQEILALAKKLAEKFSHPEVTLEHLMLSFIKVDSFLIPFIAIKVGQKFDKLEILLTDNLSYIERSKELRVPLFSKEVKGCLDYSYNLSKENSHSYISVEHILYAILNDFNSNILDYFIACDIDIVEVQDILDEILSHDIVSDPNIEPSDPSPFSTSTPFGAPNPNQNQPIDAYSVDLNALAKEGRFNHLSPNPTYISKIEEALCRKTKCCALLVGDAGVGKTALVEALANKINNIDSNDYLINQKIVSLDLPSMVAGTKYRGQFEERFKLFIEEVKDQKNIIIFIDEIHTLMGAGNSEGSLDAANMLKPYIARGEIKCIGSTTHEEYKKSFAKDPALRRRFETIKINEPTEKEAKKILSHLASSYTEFHGVCYSEDSIDEAIRLSVKYINNRRLPDKAIDLLDQAGSSLKIKFFKKPPMANQMEKALASEEIDTQTKDVIFKSYKKLLEKWGKRKSKNVPSVTCQNIREAVSLNLDIPIETLNESQSKKLIELEPRMNKEVIGQTQAIEKISNALFKTHCGLQDPARPIGSFLFLGKTGTGKTLTSKSLAANYFGSSKKLIYFDMSEFTESTSVSKFSGSSPGYVGYEKGGILTEKVKRDPHCVLLFDEVEKAHPTVLQSLLQILEEGRLTDNSGEETCFKNTIIILTSNLGANLLDKQGSVGFLDGEESSRDKIFEQAKRTLSPELVNRFDGIVLFNNFSDENLLEIIKIEFAKVRKKLKNKDIKMYFSPKVKKEVLKRTISENLGGRPIRRIIQNEIEVILAKFIINNESKSVKIDVVDNKFVCNAKIVKKK
jgi:ATP-dependent Clp protease ATP-binding subunit ClpC